MTLLMIVLCLMIFIGLFILSIYESTKNTKLWSPSILVGISIWSIVIMCKVIYDYDKKDTVEAKIEAIDEFNERMQYERDSMKAVFDNQIEELQNKQLND